MSKSQNYYSHLFLLPPNQIKMIVEAIQSKTPISLKLTKSTFKDGNIALPLTKTDALKVKEDKSFTYKLTKTKLKMMKVEEKDGGFIPLLLAGLAGLAGLVTAGSTVAKTVIDSKSKQAELQESERHNQEMEKAARGEGIFLSPWKGYGMTLGVKDFINNTPKKDGIGKKSLRNIFKILSGSYGIEREGDGIFLSYK